MADDLQQLSNSEAGKHIISNPQSIAEAFACAVTVRSDPEYLVARNGDLSIFSAFNRIFPQVQHDQFPTGSTLSQSKGKN